jgi:signal transduction histidine kinase
MTIAGGRSAAARPRRQRSKSSRLARRLVVYAISFAGLAGVVVVVYLAVVLGIGRIPSSEQTTLLAFSMIAAAVTALVYPPVARRLSEFTTRLVDQERGMPDEVLETFGNRLAVAISLDELLLQLAESLRRAFDLEAAEMWTGAGGVLERVASDPDRGRASLILTTQEEAVVAHAGVCGSAWLKVWLSQLLSGREEAELQAVPITHTGELFGLIVIEGRGESEPLTTDDEHVLAALARQLGLALNNVRLDSALQASLDELRMQADELRASRARVVAAADAERRRIERDLHDGAQQHLIALAVNLRRARNLANSDAGATRAVLEELATDVQDALDEFRDLAHGIYPPLLIDRGLVEGLRGAVARAPLPTRLETGTLRRYSPEVEATVYFCCLEALQNASKHAGADARATIRLWVEQDALQFEVADDGPGFEVETLRRGAGLTNIGDRLGALGGSLSIRSSPGDGTRVTGVVPVSPLPQPGREGRP